MYCDGVLRDVKDKNYELTGGDIDNNGLLFMGLGVYSRGRGFHHEGERFKEPGQDPACHQSLNLNKIVR